jgi:hypothetical protein
MRQRAEKIAKGQYSVSVRCPVCRGFIGGIVYKGEEAKKALTEIAWLSPCQGCCQLNNYQLVCIDTIAHCLVNELMRKLA